VSGFNIAELIVPYFSQCETAAGPSQIEVWRRGGWTIVNGRRVVGPRVQVPNIVGNIAPVSQRDLRHFADGKIEIGDLWVFTNKELKTSDEATQETAWLVRHQSLWYRIDTVDHWHYANGYRYIARRERGESNV
jgi:hypothetical protein